MSKLLKQLTRIYSSLRKIAETIIGKITKGTNTTMKTIGGLVAFVMATICLILFAAMIIIVAIPLGTFGVNSPPEEDIAQENTPTA